MTYIHVDEPRGAADLRDALSSASRIALDCEAAGFHRYSNRLCLVQVSADGRTWVLDPLAVDPVPVFREVLERPDVPVVMHGADFDLRLLGGDLGLRVRGLFDTQIAAELLGLEGLGLASLLEERFGVKLSKKYQRADWASRPLSDEMLEYAANDTRYLFELADQLAEELREKGRTAWAEQECRALEEVGEATDGAGTLEDPVVRVKGARDLSVRQVAALREALLWRDEIARDADRATFRVVGDQPLVDAVARRPRSVEDLVEVQGFPSRLAKTAGAELVERLRAVAEAPDEALVPYPRPAQRGPGRPPPEVEARANRLKEIRNRKADELGLARGTLLSNSVLMTIAIESPRTLDELARIEGMRPWRVELLGAELLEMLRRG